MRLDKRFRPFRHAVFPMLMSLLAAILLASPAPVFGRQNPPAQESDPQTTTPNSSRQQSSDTPQARHARIACLTKAGITKDMMDQRRQVVQQATSQIESVCGDTTLSNAEKQSQVRKIRQDVSKQMDDIFTAEQQKAVESCEHGARPSAFEGGARQNPCSGGSSGNPNRSGNGAKISPPKPAQPSENSSDTYQ
jgi:hypothetical protein